MKEPTGNALTTEPRVESPANNSQQGGDSDLFSGEHSQSPQDISSESQGDLLRKLRETAGYSLRQVEDYTKIRAHYVKALEDEQFDKVPSGVFIFAYVRSLCSLYKFPDKSTELLIQKLHAKIDSTVPQEFYEKVNLDYEFDPQNEQKLKHLNIIFITGAVVLLAGIVVAIVFIVTYFSSSIPPKHLDKKNINTTQITEFIIGTPQELPISKLPHKSIR